MARAILVIDVQKIYADPASSGTATQEAIKAGTAATLAAGFARVMTTAEWLAGS